MHSLKSNLYKVYGVLFFSEILHALINPTYVQLFFNEHSPLHFVSYAQRVHSYGWFMALSSIAAIFAYIFWGYLSDIYGRKLASLASYVTLFFIGILIFVTTNVYVFILAFFVFLLLNSIIPNSLSTISSMMYTHPKKLMYLGYVQIVTGGAFTLGPYIGGYIIHHYGLKLPYGITAVVALVSIGLIYFFYFPNGKSKNPTKKPKESHKLQLLHTAHLVFTNKALYILCVMLLLDQLAWGLFFLYIQPLAKLSWGLNAEQIGFLISVIGFSLVISAAFILPALEKVLSINWIIIIAISSMILGTLLLCFLLLFHLTQHHWPLYLLSGLIAFGDMVIFTAISTGFSNNMPKGAQGTSIGLLYSLAKGFVWTASALLGGYLLTIHTVLAPALMLISSIGLLLVYIKIAHKQYFSTHK